MPNILFIKTSSLGDVVHHMPALTEARRNCPGAQFTWVVEETLAPLVRLHPAVEVIPVATRRWRKSFYLPSTWLEMRRFVQTVRARSYDKVIDTQGLMRSALITRAARGQRHGYDVHSIRERLAVPVYDVRHGVDRRLHAIERNRLLAGLALGYTPAGPPDYGLDRERLAASRTSPYGIFLHGTAQRGKQWPEERWTALGAALGGSHDLVLPWGTNAERVRAERIAAALPRARVLERQPLDAVARLTAGASFVIGVDTGLSHLAAALGVPLVAIFAGSEVGLTGPIGSGPIVVVGKKGMLPSVEEVAGAAKRVGVLSGTR